MGEDVTVEITDLIGMFNLCEFIHQMVYLLQYVLYVCIYTHLNTHIYYDFHPLYHKKNRVELKMPQ